MKTAPTRSSRWAGTRDTSLVPHGPNLNLLRTREPAVYGKETLTDLGARRVARPIGKLKG